MTKEKIRMAKKVESDKVKVKENFEQIMKKSKNTLTVEVIREMFPGDEEMVNKFESKKIY